MTITLPLEPQTEAKLIALAKEKGVTAHELVRQAIDQIIAEASEPRAGTLPVWNLGAPSALRRRDIYDDAR